MAQFINDAPVDVKIAVLVGWLFQNALHVIPLVFKGAAWNDVHAFHVHARQARVSDGAVHEGIGLDVVLLHVWPQSGHIQEAFRFKAGTAQTAKVSVEGDGGVEDHIGDHAVFLEPDFVAEDAVFGSGGTCP